jgi:tRNA-dihydrouridine synthase B
MTLNKALNSSAGESAFLRSAPLSISIGNDLEDLSLPQLETKHDRLIRVNELRKTRKTLDQLSPNPILLAPMVGLTHYAVRAALAEFLPEGQRALWYTEMLNSRRIPSQKENEAPEIMFHDRENGICPQLLANEEEYIRLSMPRLERWGASAVDINMGCPVIKALKHNYGVALMGDPVYAAEVVRMTVKHSPMPVSVKLRAAPAVNAEGVTQDFEYLEKFIGGLVDAGADWITLHPRTAEQKRKGSADWNMIKRLKNSRVLFSPEGKNIPVLGNGDIQCGEDITRMFEETGCDRVMIGRALIVKPWLIRGGPDPDVDTQGELYGQFLKSVLRKSREHYPEAAGMRRMRFLAVQGRAWVEFGEYLCGRLHAAQNYEQMASALELFFSQKQRIVKRTELRT